MGEAQGEVLRNVAPETTRNELDAVYAATARDNPLYPYEPEIERLAARQRRRGMTSEMSSWKQAAAA